MLRIILGLIILITLGLLLGLIGPRCGLSAEIQEEDVQAVEDGVFDVHL